ncbi:MAG: glycosyltransferase [Microbacteriaceae bacterium]|nr:MAG: glycosyltransferase [Microbacteriaceae bacterium]
MTAHDMTAHDMTAHDMTGLHIVHVVCSSAFAGVERYVRDSALALETAGCRVTVIGGAEAWMRAPLLARGVEWYPARNVWEAFGALRRVHAVDVIVTHMTLADLAGVGVGILRRVPVVSTRHFAAHRGRNALNRVLVHALQRRIARQIAISQFVAQHVEGESVVIHTGVADVADVDDRGRAPFVLVLQRFESEKHTGTALRAWAQAGRFDGWRLVLAGDGSERDELRDLARRLGVADTVDFIGFQSDVDALLRRASILIAPTPREGLGLAVIEAMAYGLPVVAAGGGGHLETVGPVAEAALFPVDDSERAGRLLAELIDDPERRYRYGHALRERQRSHFGIQAQLRDTLGVLREVVHDGGRLRIVVASLEPWDEVWRRNQYLVHGLLGEDPAVEVLFVEPPADPVHALSRAGRPHRGRGLRTVEGYDGRLHLYQPTKTLPRAIGPAADALLRRSIRHALRRLGWRTGVLWINDPGVSGLVSALGWPCLYDITDDWVEARRGARTHTRLRRADRELLSSCDEVIVCSPALARTKGAARQVRLIPNAVDVDRYRRPQPRPTDMTGAPVALYVGTLHEDRLDVQLVLDTATAVGAVGGTLALVGPDALSHDNSSRLARHPAITVLGPRDRAAVPAYLQHAHVLIVPHVVDDFTESLDPIKLYEYVAVGRPIVSTAVAGFREHEGATTVGRDEFPTVVASALAHWSPTVEYAAVPDWHDRVAAVHEVVASLAARPATPGG